MRAKFVGREVLTEKLRKLVPNAEKEYAQAIETSAKELANSIRSRAPRDSGEYVASINADKLSNRTGKSQVGIQQTKDQNAWGIYANYIWRFIEYGTKSHIIKAKNAKRLFWRTDAGNSATAAQVSHPGQAAQPHIFPTYRAMRKRIRSRVARSINKAVRAVAAGGKS